MPRSGRRRAAAAARRRRRTPNGPKTPRPACRPAPAPGAGAEPKLNAAAAGAGAGASGDRTPKHEGRLRRAENLSATALSPLSPKAGVDVAKDTDFLAGGLSGAGVAPNEIGTGVGAGGGRPASRR